MVQPTTEKNRSLTFWDAQAYLWPFLQDYTCIMFVVPPVDTLPGIGIPHQFLLCLACCGAERWVQTPALLCLPAVDGAAFWGSLQINNSEKTLNCPEDWISSLLFTVWEMWMDNKGDRKLPFSYPLIWSWVQLGCNCAIKLELGLIASYHMVFL